MIRPARVEDWPGVRDLLIELGRPDVRTDDAAHRDAFIAYLGRPDTEALVAEVDGAIVGFVDLEFRARLHFSTPQAWIPDLIVTERARSAGIGAALLDGCERLARERGCWGLTLESASWRERAHAFYRRHGMTDAALSFSKPLDDTPWPPPPPR